MSHAPRTLTVIATGLALCLPTIAACTPAGTGGSVKSAAAPLAMLPARLLTCDMGHATNLDLSHEQSTDELVFDAHHPLSLFLPSIPVRTSPPPDAVDPAEPVHPATRVTHDPDHVASNVIGPFIRVVDTWPERVELIQPMKDGQSKLFVITDTDEATHTARIFMTDAKDLVTYDMDRVFLGPCTVETGARAIALAKKR